MNAPAQAGNGLNTAASETAVDRAFGDNSIDALLSEIESQDDTETVEDEPESDEMEQSDSESDDEAEEQSAEKTDTASNGKSDQKADTPKGKGVGWDKVLQVLDKTDPQAAAAARTFQGEWTRIKQAESDTGKRLEEAKSLQNQLREALEEVKAIKDNPEQEQQEAPSLEELLPNVPPAQREAFKAAFEVLKDQMGLVSKNELQSAEDKKAQAEYVKSLHTEHAKKFGEQFGTVNDKGELIISPELKPKLEAVRERLASNKQGVTWADLHILANHDDIVKAAAEKAVADYRESLKAKNATKVAALRKGTTIESSTNQGGTRFTRSKGESAKQTVDRAFELAWASLPGR